MLPKGFIQLTGYCYNNKVLLRLADVVDVWEDPDVKDKQAVKNPCTWINTTQVETPFQVRESYSEVLSRMRIASPA